MIGDIFIGYDVLGSAVRLMLKDLLKSMLVCGIIGSGKTALLTLIVSQFLMKNITVWWIDQSKRDGLSLARMFPSMQHFRPNHNFFWNPFQITQGLDILEIVPRVTEQFCRDMHLLLGSESYMSEMVFQTLERMRRNNILQAPTLYDIRDTILQDRTRSARASDYRTVVLGRIQFLLNHIGRMLHVHQGFDLLKLSMTSFVLDLVGLPAEIQRFIIGSLIYSLVSLRQALGILTNDLNLLIVYDEANRLFPRNEELNPAESIPILSQLTQISREYGVGFLGACQAPSFMANSGLKSQSYIKAIVGSLGSNEDYYDMGNVMGMTSDQIEWLKTHGETGKAVVKLAGGKFAQPFMVRIPFLNLKGIDQG